MLRKTEFKVFLILLVFALVIGGGAWFYYRWQERALLKQAQEQLTAVADLKAVDIQRWREDKLGDARWIHSDELIRALACDFLRNPADPLLRSRLHKWMKDCCEHQRIARMVLLGPSGDIMLASPESEAWVGPLARQKVAEAFATGDILLSDLHLSLVSFKPNMDLIVPVLAAGLEDSAPGWPEGVFMMEIDPQVYLYPLIQSWPTPSSTAETTLVCREGNDVLFLSDLRHRPESSLKLRLPLAQTPRMAASLALTQGDGVYRALDYRDVPVLAVTRTIPNSPWHIVSKRDLSEIFAPLRQEAWTVFALAGTLFLSAALGLLALWRHREHQISLQQLEEQRTTQAALELSARKLLEAHRISRIGSYELDLVTGLWTGTATLDELFGLGASDTHRRDDALWQVILHPDDRAEMNRYFQVEVLQGGRPFDHEYRILRLNDGAERWVHGLGHVNYGAMGKPLQMVGTLQDITERKNAEVERKRLLRTLVRKNRELEGIIYVSSHDLRSPLVNIQGFSRRVQTTCTDLEGLIAASSDSSLKAVCEPLFSKRLAPALKFIYSSVVKMDELLHGLLRLSRLGRAGLKIVPLDMDALLKSSIDSLSFQTQEAGARIEGEKLPPCQGDPIQIAQVFTNLLDNAIKYRDPLRPLIVRVHAKVLGNETEYCVEDNGKGIAPEYHEKIWEIFQRLDPNDRLGGQGLGLTIIVQIMDRHEGRVWVESEEGRGSRFFFSLPHKAVPTESAGA